MKKGTAKAMRYIVAGSALTLCVIMTGCGCGQKKTDPASEQVLKISITPEPSPTPAPDTVDAAAVTSNGDISMVYLYCLSPLMDFLPDTGESVSGRKSISGDKQYRYGCG